MPNPLTMFLIFILVICAVYLASLALIAMSRGLLRKLGNPMGFPLCDAPPRASTSDLLWLVTYQRIDGTLATADVLLNGSNPQADIHELAQQALRTQHDIDCARLVRISIDYRATPARVELLDRITRDYNARLRFEAECG